MKICFLSSMHPPLDKRVFYKEARGLSKAGYEVVHLAPGDGKEWTEEGVRIITYKPPKGLWARVMQMRSLYARARLIDADVYHCNELDSWLVGAMLRLFSKRMFVFDVHEHYPEDFAEHYCPSWLRPVVVFSLSLLINVVSRFTSGVVLAKASLVCNFSHLPPTRVALVENFVPLSDLQLQVRQQSNAALRMIHLGLFNRERGWPQLLEAMAMTRHRNIDLRIVGEINDGSDLQFHNEIERLGLKHCVHFDKWLPYDEAMACVMAADVGLILFQPGLFNHTHALPHKMFDYMAAGLAVVAPDFAVEVSRIVTVTRCGVLVDPQSPQSIAAAIDWFCDNPQLRTEMGRFGQISVTERYNWGMELEKLLTMYRRFETSLPR